MTRVADISVLIVAYRSRATIGACLEALARQTVQPREVFLLENGSPAGEAVRPDEVPDGIRFVTSSKNLGFAGGNNRLAREATGRWIACLNPDAYARPDWIEALETAMGFGDDPGKSPFARATVRSLRGTNDPTSSQ